MILNRANLRTVSKFALTALLFSSSMTFAQTRASVGLVSVGVTLNGTAATAPPPPVAGACITQALLNQMGAVVRVTCVDNPFVSIKPSIDSQFPGTFGNTFRYPLHSSPSSFNLVTSSIFSFNQISRLFGSVSGNNFNSPTSTVTDMSIYRTAPQATLDSQGDLDMMNMVISF